MKHRLPIIATRLLVAGLLVVATFVSVEQKLLAAEPPTDRAHAAHVAAAANQAGGQTIEAQLQTIAVQMAELHAKMQRLEAAIQQQSGASSGAMPMSRTPGTELGTKRMKGKMSGMGGMMQDMDMGQMGMGGMGATQPGRGMGGTQGMRGMMGRRPAGQGMMMGGMPMPSALPAFPGAVNLYHIGETGFFLDQTQRIAMNNDQQAMLNEIQQRALRQDATYQQQIDDAEEQLWFLTSSDRPDTTRIATKVREIERLRSDRRLAFIHAVGEAAGVLTEDQRQALTTGASPSAMPSADQAAGPAQHQHQP